MKSLTFEPQQVEKTKKPTKQQRLYEFLKKNENKAFTMSQLCKELGIGISGVVCNLLETHDKINILKLPCGCKMYYVGKFKI